MASLYFINISQQIKFTTYLKNYNSVSLPQSNQITQQLLNLIL